MKSTRTNCTQQKQNIKTNKQTNKQKTEKQDAKNIAIQIQKAKPRDQKAATSKKHNVKHKDSKEQDLVKNTRPRNTSKTRKARSRAGLE